MKNKIHASGLIRFICLLLVPLVLTACSSPQLQNNALNSVTHPATLRTEALSLVNKARRQAGVAQLQAMPLLDRVAQAHAEDMARRGFYAHRSPEGKDVGDRLRAAGGEFWSIIGENIYTCQACTPDQNGVARFQEAWMKSPGHRRNILEARFTRFGFGVAQAGGRIYAVQVFYTQRNY